MTGQRPKLFYDNSIGIRTMPSVRVRYIDKLRQVCGECEAGISRKFIVCAEIMIDRPFWYDNGFALNVGGTTSYLLRGVSRCMKRKLTFKIKSLFI